MFSTILIANRGEIARRVARTCGRMGIRTVTVHSEADTGALFVRESDRSILLGPAPVRESYLRIDRILDAARETGAEAIHPGYGLLSESVAFAQAVEDAGLSFIGPSSTTMARLGSKLAARSLAHELDIPTLPASEAIDPADQGALVAAAAAVGFPAILKLSGGGGGIGMARVDSPDRLAKAAATAARRGASSFADARIYLERFVPRGRHVEVQVVGGGDFGPHTVLGDRDCSTQRRHQKIVEEGPAPSLPEGVRERIWGAAHRICAAVAYAGAGTVEFLVEDDGRAWFLEMNTRIQVEHPVTEAVTGLDLVECQIEAADRRPWRHGAVEARGHAIELRLYAEDPDHFLPQPGRVDQLRWPEGEGLRIDHSLEEGQEITPHYDPLLAKIIAWGEDREEARKRAVGAIDGLVLSGVRHNAPALRQVITSAAFAEGRLHTGLLSELRGGA